VFILVEDTLKAFVGDAMVPGLMNAGGEVPPTESKMSIAVSGHAA